MKIHVQFWSYFRDLAGVSDLELDLPPGTTVADAQQAVYERHPVLAAARKSTLVAVGVEYRPPDHALQDGDQLSLFPPVQGG